MLDQQQILGHSLVTAELCMGSIPNRASTIQMLDDLRYALDVETVEVRAFVEARKLYSRGIGLVDATILASCMFGDGIRLWTRDRRLNVIAGELGIAYQPLH